MFSNFDILIYRFKLLPGRTGVHYMTKQRAPSHNSDDPPTRSNAENVAPTKYCDCQKVKISVSDSFGRLRREKLGLRKKNPRLVQNTNFSSRILDSDQAKKIRWLIVMFCFQPSKTASDCSSCHRCARQGRTGDPIQYLQVKHSSDWKYKSWYDWKAAQERNLISDRHSCELQRND